MKLKPANIQSQLSQSKLACACFFLPFARFTDRFSVEQDGASAVLGLHRNQENRSCHALPEAFFREDREDPPGDAFVVCSGLSSLIANRSISKICCILHLFPDGPKGLQIVSRD
jgi:hypothetical protein